MSRCIVTVGVSPNRIFAPYLKRFQETFTLYGQAKLLIWNKVFPPGSPTHQQAHYAFKVFAVLDAFRRGHTSILWFDCDAYAFAPLTPMWERLERDGHYLVADTPNSLAKWCGDHTLEHFRMTRDRAENLPILSGTCWGVDLTKPRSLIFVNRLRELAVPAHFNGTHAKRGLPAHPRQGTEGAIVSSDPRCWGHRSDECVSALLAHGLGMETDKDCVEFIGGLPERMNPKACVKSGYDLQVGLP